MVNKMYLATLASIILLTGRHGKSDEKELFLENETIELAENDEEEKTNFNHKKEDF